MKKLIVVLIMACLVLSLCTLGNNLDAKANQTKGDTFDSRSVVENLRVHEEQIKELKLALAVEKSTQYYANQILYGYIKQLKEDVKKLKEKGKCKDKEESPDKEKPDCDGTC